MINPKTFFLVDDDEDDRELFGLALEEADASILLLTANSGAEALHMLTRERLRPDTIFLDLNMPMMDGKECLAELKNDPQTRDIPVIIFSTSSDPSDRLETARLGAVDFITKPSSIIELTRLLVQFTGNSVHSI